MKWTFLRNFEAKNNNDGSNLSVKKIWFTYGMSHKLKKNDYDTRSIKNRLKIIFVFGRP